MMPAVGASPRYKLTREELKKIEEQVNYKSTKEGTQARPSVSTVTGAAAGAHGHTFSGPNFFGNIKDEGNSIALNH